MRPTSSCSIGLKLPAAFLCVPAVVVAAIAISPWRAEAQVEHQPASAKIGSSELTVTIGVQANDNVGETPVVPPSLEIGAGEEGREAEAGDAERIAKATATHHQTGLIDANVAGQPRASLKCFCLTPDNRILAGCAAEAANCLCSLRVGESRWNRSETGASIWGHSPAECKSLR